MRFLHDGVVLSALRAGRSNAYVSWIGFTNSVDIAGKDEETLPPFRLDPRSCLPAGTTSARM